MDTKINVQNLPFKTGCNGSVFTFTVTDSFLKENFPSRSFYGVCFVRIYFERFEGKYYLSSFGFFKHSNDVIYRKCALPSVNKRIAKNKTLAYYIADVINNSVDFKNV